MPGAVVTAVLPATCFLSGPSLAGGGWGTGQAGGAADGRHPGGAGRLWGTLALKQVQVSAESPSEEKPGWAEAGAPFLCLGGRLLSVKFPFYFSIFSTVWM